MKNPLSFLGFGKKPAEPTTNTVQQETTVAPTSETGTEVPNVSQPTSNYTTVPSQPVQTDTNSSNVIVSPQPNEEQAVPPSDETQAPSFNTEQPSTQPVNSDVVEQQSQPQPVSEAIAQSPAPEEPVLPPAPESPQVPPSDPPAENTEQEPAPFNNQAL